MKRCWVKATLKDNNSRFHSLTFFLLHTTAVAPVVFYTRQNDSSTRMNEGR